MGNVLLHRSRSRQRCSDRGEQTAPKPRFMMRFLRSERNSDVIKKTKTHCEDYSQHEAHYLSTPNTRSSNDDANSTKHDDDDDDSELCYSNFNESLLGDQDTSTVFSYPFDEIDSWISEKDDYFHSFICTTTISKNDEKAETKTKLSDPLTLSYQNANTSVHSTCTSDTEKCSNSVARHDKKQSNNVNGIKSFEKKEGYGDFDSIAKFFGAFLDFSEQNHQQSSESSFKLFPNDHVFHCDWTFGPCPNISSSTSFSSNSSPPITPIRTRENVAKTSSNRNVLTKQKRKTDVYCSCEEDILANDPLCCFDEMVFVSNSFDEAVWSAYRKYDKYCYEDKNVNSGTAFPIKFIGKKNHEHHYYYSDEVQLAPSDEENELSIRM